MNRFYCSVFGGLALGMALPSIGTACDFSYPPSTTLFERASDIFVGKVIESPWRTVNGTIAVTGKSLVRFSIVRNLRGTTTSEATFNFRSDCDFPFLEGETYLVHASRRDGKLETGQHWRPLLLRDAAEPLKYIEGALAKRALGILYGIAVVANLPSTSSSVSVHLQRNNDSFQATINPSQYYEVAAPPGEYSVWLEVDGIRVGQRKMARLIQGKATLQQLDAALVR
jgi:hypothetical protein